MTKVPETLVDEIRDGRYVRVWKEGHSRGHYLILIWETDKPEGRPKWEWSMPSIAGLDKSVTKALYQSSNQ